MILICAIVAAKVLAVDRKDKEPSATKWEHLALEHHLKRYDDPSKHIIKLGQEGWQLVTVENFSESGTTTKTVYYFRRRL